jgi:hypothetical protein
MAGLGPAICVFPLNRDGLKLVLLAHCWHLKRPPAN